MHTPEAVPSSPSPSPHAETGVLLVEDDAAVAEVVATALEVRGYRVRVAADGASALHAASLDTPDVVVLDLGLPDLDGIVVCRRLRTWTRNPIIVLSADGAEDRKIAALDEGADDYVTKPFSMPELLARLRVAERHRHLLAATTDDTVLSVGDLVVDTAARSAHVGGANLELTRREFDLLALLARNAGRVLTHRTLLEQVWGDAAAGTASLRVHVTQLRRKLGDGAATPRVLSDPGTGYRLALPDAV